MYEYLIILIVFLLIAMLLEWKFRIQLYKSWKQRVAIPIVFLLIGIVWDNFMIYKGIWSFPGAGLIGIRIGVMPIEEYLFALIIPYFVLTLYEVLVRKI